MDNFKIIYRILKALEKVMDSEEFDVSTIFHETLKISYPRWEKTLIMLVKA
ncbi:MAG: YjcQ family protein [Clostridium sp.]